MKGFRSIHFSRGGDPEKDGQPRLQALTKDAAPRDRDPNDRPSADVLRMLNSPEAASRLYLQTYLEDADSDELTEIASPNRPELVPDLRTVSSSPSPQLATQSTTFQQTWNGIVVFGGRVVVDVDETDRSLVSINGQLATAPTLPSDARLSISHAAKAIESWAREGKVPSDAVAELNWLYTDDDSPWHLAWHFLKLPILPPEMEDTDELAFGTEPDHSYCLGPSPRSTYAVYDVLVDANDGRVLLYFSSAPALDVPIPMTGNDANHALRSFHGLQTPAGYTLSDPLRNIATYDFGYKDIDVRPLLPLPPSPIGHPDRDLLNAHPAAVSAHHNATVVFDFYNDVLKRNGIDDRGMHLVSVVNVWSSAGGSPSPDWLNAVWWNQRMWYGEWQGKSLAAYLDIIAHELTHGVTESSSNLMYRDLSGALNESYSDIFGVIIANWHPNQPNPVSMWEWKIGKDLGRGGGPIRDFSNPSATGQPAHFSQYKKIARDHGGVHLYSGIHNKAIYNLLTDTDLSGNSTFPVREAVLLLYLTLVRLTPISDFFDSRRTLESVTRAYYGNTQARNERLDAIDRAFGKVGL